MTSTNADNFINPLYLPDNSSNASLAYLNITSGLAAGVGVTNGLLNVNGTNMLEASVSSDGANNATNRQLRTPVGLGSLATDAAINIPAAGWTNSVGKNATVYFDGTGVTFIVFNNALTPVYTNAATVTHGTVNLQPGGGISFTAGSLITGRATPW